VSAFDQVIARCLPLIPRPIVRAVSRRYIAGEIFADAARVITSLNREGLLATVDVLGESVDRAELVGRAVGEYLEALDAIRRDDLRCNISVKPTQLGLMIDAALCLDSVRRLARAARDHGNFVRLDMEDSRCTGATLDLHRTLRAEGFGNLGVVLQACLRRSLDDVRDLPEGTSVRLCKGIYIEPRVIAYRERALINKNFVRLLGEMLDRGLYVGIATHDEEVVWEALQLIDRRRVPTEAYEFQMLLGVDQELRGMIRAAGHRLRVYVPYGSSWYAYSVRRLKENPRIAGYVVRSLLAPRRP